MLKTCSACFLRSVKDGGCASAVAFVRELSLFIEFSEINIPSTSASRHR